MISAIDILCIAIAVGLIVVEGQRGLVLSLVDLAGILVAVVIGGFTYRWLHPYVGTYSTAYLICVGLPLAGVVTLGVVLTMRTKEYVRGWEAAVGALVGLCSGIVVAYTIYTYLAMRYGVGSSLLKDSLLTYQFDERGIVHELTAFVRTLAGR